MSGRLSRRKDENSQVAAPRGTKPVMEHLCGRRLADTQ